MHKIARKLFVNGARIKERRTELNLTQMDLARHSGLSLMTISKCEIEKDYNPLLSTMDAVASLLGLNLADLITTSSSTDQHESVLPDSGQTNP